MGSREKYFGVQSADHGFDDIGWAQPTGTINSVAKYNVGQYWKYALVTANAAHNLTKGMRINITGSTDYDGPTRIVAVPSSTTFVIKRGFTVTKTGNWDLRTVEGNWDAIQPIGANVTGATNIAYEFWKPDMEGGNEALPNLTIDKLYPMPGLKKVTLNSSGNLRLYRAASTKPGNGINKSLPTIVGYSPATASIGATLDIIGTNFDPVPDRNAVRFFNGVRANVTVATEEILTIVIPTGAAATGVVAVITNGGQNASGPVFTAG